MQNGSTFSLTVMPYWQRVSDHYGTSLLPQRAALTVPNHGPNWHAVYYC